MLQRVEADARVHLDFETDDERRRCSDLRLWERGVEKRWIRCGLWERRVGTCSALFHLSLTIFPAGAQLWDE